MARLYNLTGNNIKGTPIVRRPDWDFEDDGSNFRCFEYRGLRISVSTYARELFLHLDYRPLANFPWEDWKGVEEYKLCDKYNGTREGFEMTELIADCDRLIDKIAEMNKAFDEEVIDIKPLLDRLANEVVMVESDLWRLKRDFQWWEVTSKYELANFIDYFHAYEKKLKNIYDTTVSIKNQSMPKKRVKELIYRLEKYHYVCVGEDDFYKKRLDEALTKYNNAHRECC